MINVYGVEPRLKLTAFYQKDKAEHNITGGLIETGIKISIPTRQPDTPMLVAVSSF